MKTAIHGILVEVGTPADSTQPWALVHCTKAQIRAVERLSLLQPVTIVETAELVAMADEITRVTQLLVDLNQTLRREQEAFTAAAERASKAESEVVRLRQQRAEGVSDA